MESPYTGKQVQLIAGGGLYNGRTVAAALALGASAVGIGTRFILSEESGASDWHKAQLQKARHGDIIRSIIFSGRLLHSLATPYLRKWEEDRRHEMLTLQAKGIVPVQHDLKQHPDDEEVLDGQGGTLGQGQLACKNDRGRLGQRGGGYTERAGAVGR